MLHPLRTLCFLLALLLAATGGAAQGRQVAITIDDLPRGGDGGPRDLPAVRAMTSKLLRPIRAQKIPVTGFVNAGRHALDARGLREVLDLWLDAGAELGNHSYSHPDLDEVPLDLYTADIIKGEPAIRSALAARGKTLEYYRHPYLHVGTTADVKLKLQAFLNQHGYRVAPVTLDTADYMFAALYTRPAYRERARRDYLPYLESVVAFFELRSTEVLGHEVPQILLIHASELNADLMPELLAMFRRRGYTFVSLSQALQDPAYREPDTYAGRGGFSWIHRWAMAKGLPNKGEPDPAGWVLKAYATRP
jgi:peptidoglycan/xylan/chitin deacetylase (PgdA/CDA1 family)